MQNNHFFKVAYPAFWVFALLFLVGFSASAVWSPPTLAPPLGNVPSPLNVGTDNQTKTGGILTVQDFWVNNAMGVTGGATFGGSVGIGTPSPGEELTIRSSAPSLALSIAGTAAAQQSFLNLFTKDAGVLGVFETGDKGWHITGRGDAWAAPQTNDLIFWRYDSGWSSPLLVIDSLTGNVGIGTAGPLSSRLTVTGTIESTSGGVKFPDGTVQASAAAAAGAGGWTDDGANVRLTTTADNVGIGTASPQARLHVEGSMRLRNGISDPIFYINTRASDKSSQIVFTSNPETSFDELAMIGTSLSGVDNLDLYSQRGAIAFRTGGTSYNTGSEHMRITNNGNVGIGTTTPRSRLDIAPAAGEESIFGIDRLVGLNDLRFYTDNAGTTERMRLSGTGGLSIGSGYVATDPGAGSVIVEGNVGIGDSTPLALFTVGSGDLFRVDSSGNLIRINNVPYSWPAAQGAAGTVLTNNGAGTLSWGVVGGGDITGVTAGSGLTGGGASGDVTLDIGAGTGITVGADSISVNTAVIQSRVSGTCAVGSSVRVVNADGTVSCETDDVGVVVETDPQVGAVTSGQWCRGDGSAVQCDLSGYVAGGWYGGCIYQAAPASCLGATAPAYCSGVSCLCPGGFSTLEYRVQPVGGTFWYYYTCIKT